MTEIAGLLDAIQAGGNIALVMIAGHIIRLDRRVLRLEIKTGHEPEKKA